MKVLNRKHNFEDRLNQVRMGRKYFYLYHEHTKEGHGIRIPRTPQLDEAFVSEDWDVFQTAEANALGGEYISLQNGRTIRQF